MLTLWSARHCSDLESPLVSLPMKLRVWLFWAQKRCQHRFLAQVLHLSWAPAPMVHKGCNSMERELEIQRQVQLHSPGTEHCSLFSLVGLFSFFRVSIRDWIWGFPIYSALPPPKLTAARLAKSVASSSREKLLVPAGTFLSNSQSFVSVDSCSFRNWLYLYQLDLWSQWKGMRQIHGISC